MKKPTNWIGFIILGLILCILFLDRCYRPVYKDSKSIDTIEIIKVRIDTLEKEVVKWKESKTKIIYRTKFDTLATIDTVLIELAKCDTIVKIDSIIIHKQDTIIQGQKTVISDLDSRNMVLEKEVKKQKRKLVFTKILSGAAIIAIILISL